MPYSLCMEPGAHCPNRAVYRGRCRTHATQREYATHPNRAFYNSKRWKMQARAVLFDEPLCQWPCEEGHALATEVDHIVPISKGGERWSRSNLQSLCHAHHSVKTRKEQSE